MFSIVSMRTQVQAQQYTTVSDGKIQKKNVFTQKEIISTSKRHAEHPFAGRNTQHLNIFLHKREKPNKL